MFLKALSVRHSWAITKTLRVMKLTAIILLSACLAASAKGLAQKVTISVKDAPLEKVFDQIKKQTGFSFLWDEKTLKQARPVTFDLKEATVEEVMNACVKNQPLTYSIIQNLVVIKEKIATSPNEVTTTDPPPPIDVHGKVLNEKGEPVVGASVKIKGSKNGTSTNENGEFTLNGISADDATLVISGTNIETFEVKVGDKTDFTLKAKTKIVSGEEVQIYSTGYQQIPKERATGSFVQLDNTIINEQSGTFILDRLKGIANGVFFDNPSGNRGNRPATLIRGFSTIAAPAAPLIVLDNFPYEGNLNNINPNDIETITILKDAAATSIWGVRAGNGVIVITTKKGRFNQPTKVEFNSNVTIIQKPDLFYLRPIATNDLINVETTLFSKGFYNSQISNSSRPTLSPVVEILNKRKLGQITAADSATQIDALRGLDIRNDYDKYIYQNAVNQQYSVNLSGGSDKMTYLFSTGLDKNFDNLSAEYNRINFRLNNSFRPVRNLQISTAAYYTNSKAINGKPAYGSTFINSTTQRLWPYFRLADANGNSAPLNTYRQGYLDTVGRGKLLDWRMYLLDDWKHNTTTTNLQDLTATLGLQYKFLNHFNLNLQYQYERQQTTTDVLRDLQSFFARDQINRFSQINYTTGVVTYIVPKAGIIDKSTSLVAYHGGRAQINYDQTWNKHNVVAIVGSEIREVNTQSNTFRAYGYNPDLATAQNIDYITTYPTIITGAKQAIQNNLQFSDKTNRYVSILANVAYTFDSKYTISGSARKDASNLFGVNSNNKWKPLWSTGASWNISDEGFYKASFIPVLRLRTTYGYSGNVSPTLSALTAIRYFGAAPFTNFQYAAINQYANPDLHWEKLGQINIAIDFATKKNTLSGSAEYFIKKGSDLYGSSPVDYTAGLYTYSVIKNVADIKGKGVDINIESKNVDRVFKWFTTLNFNYNSSKVTNYYLTTTTGANFVGGGGVFSGIIGKPLYAVWSYQWAGLDSSGNPQGVLNKAPSTNYSLITGSGTTINDLTYSGSATPTVYGNLSNSFNWKGITLSANITYKFGYYFMKQSINYGSLFSQYNGNADFANRWQKPGDEKSTTIPAMIYPNNSNRDNFYNSSEILVRKGDHIRLQFVTLSYDLSKNNFKKFPFDNIQVYVNASNLGIIWRANKDGIDPDYGNTLPQSKSITFGIKGRL